MPDEKSAVAGRIGGPATPDVDAKIKDALAAHLQSPEFAAKVKELSGHEKPSSEATSSPDDGRIVKVLIENADEIFDHPKVIAANRKHSVGPDELRPDAMKKYRPGMTY